MISLVLAAFAPLRDVRDIDPVTASTDDGISVRIQLLKSDGYEPWPTELTDVHQRYSDAAPVRLRIPSRDAFAAWKTVTWMDRAAPRDLYDLWALARIGALTEAAAQLFAEHGPTASPPKEWMFSTAPTPERWREQLAGQTRLTVTADEALEAVRTAWMT